jgi:hypothetical protein
VLSVPGHGNFRRSLAPFGFKQTNDKVSHLRLRLSTCAYGSQPAPTALTCAYGCGSNFYFLETTPIAMEKARKKIAEFEKSPK